MALQRAIAAAAAVLIAGPAVGLAQAAAPPPGIEWDALTKAIHKIQKARSHDEAAAAYASGCSINRQSVELQTAYMRRQLQLGRPDTAWHAAKVLLQLRPRTGLAQGVVAYMFAKRDNYAAAFPPGVQAAELEKENPSICQNAAQLLAWHEGAKRKAPLTDLTLTLKKLKSSSTSGKLFADAYRKARRDYAKLDDEKKQKKAKADEAEEEAKKIKEEGQKLARDLDGRKRRYDSEARRIRSRQRELERVEHEVARSGDYNQRRSLERRRDSTRRNLRRAQDSLSKTRSEARKIKKQLDALEERYKSKLAAANRLRREANAAMEGVPVSFKWQPPAVDGVVTPDALVAKAKPKPRTSAKDRPVKTYLAPTKAKTTPAVKTVGLASRLAEAEAADKLGLAKIYVNGKMNTAAKKLLDEILGSYPNTAAAKEAAELRKKLP